MPQAKTHFDAFMALVNRATEIDWARLAAYVDSEGTVFINSNKGGRSHTLTVVVSNTDLRLIKWLQDTFSGQTYVVGKANRVPDPNAKVKSQYVCWSWRLFEERAEVVLRRILPYMIMKREQAEVGVAYRDLKRQGSRGMKVTPEVLAARDEMKAKIISLNQSREHKVQAR